MSYGGPPSGEILWGIFKPMILIGAAIWAFFIVVALCIYFPPFTALVVIAAVYWWIMRKIKKEQEAEKEKEEEEEKKERQMKKGDDEEAKNFVLTPPMYGARLKPEKGYLDPDEVVAHEEDDMGSFHADSPDEWLPEEILEAFACGDDPPPMKSRKEMERRMKELEEEEWEENL